MGCGNFFGTPSKVKKPGRAVAYFWSRNNLKVDGKKSKKKTTIYCDCLLGWSVVSGVATPLAQFLEDTYIIRAWGEDAVRLQFANATDLLPKLVITHHDVFKL
jgi:hypothetical protein